MSGVRRALIVATDEYSDPKLTRLNAPANDARALADVLRDESVGAFQVETVLNRTCHEVEVAIARFFADAKRGDTLLAHFSCHGVKDLSGELYFATADTDLSLLKVTGVSSALVREAMEESRAGLILCLVDCCYSGAFTRSTKAAATIDLTERLGGHGRAVITASTSLQLALDGEEQPSLFTRAVVAGLQSGDADRDLDGLVSLDELYSYVHDQVTSQNPDQTPVKSFDVRGEVYVARRRAPVTTPAPLDPDLLADARSEVKYKRLGAVRGLAEIIGQGHPGRSLAARQELDRMARDDDSLSVQREARKALDGAGALPMPAIPDYEPVGATRGSRTVEEEPATEQPVPEEAVPEGPVPEEPSGDGAEGGTTTGHWWTHDGRLKLLGLAALAVLGVLVVGGVAWRLAGTGAPDSGGEENGGPILAPSRLLMATTDSRGHHLLSFDVEKRRTVDLDVGFSPTFPTVSEDRRWMVYLADDGTGGVPHLARVDGRDDRRLLDADSTKACPYTSRPTFSPDGGFLALMCRDAADEAISLDVVDRDGRLVRTLTSGSDLAGAPSWGGDGRIYFMRETAGGATTLWSVPAEGGRDERVTDGSDGSDSHPDWSENGLLFLRTRPGGSSDAYVMDLGSKDLRRISTSGRADSPTWAPYDQPTVAWREHVGEGRAKTLWVREGGQSPAVRMTGNFGPPAWGSR